MNSDRRKEESREEGPFERVFVRPPPNDYPNCNSTNPDKEGIDLALARKQHREYISILKESGIEVVQLPVLDGYPDSVFTQDPAIIGRDKTIVGRFGLKSRAGEETKMVDDLKAGDWGIGTAQFIKEPGRLEGGDIMITDTRIFAGDSSRTNKEGIRQLASQLQDRPIIPVKTKSFHLLCGCSYIGENTIAVAPGIVDVKPFAGFNIIQVPDEDEYAANILRLGKRKVLIPSGYPKTYAKLRGAGFRVVEIDNSEFYKGDGGLTCLSSPVYSVL
jgi:dimethylargininase